MLGQDVQGLGAGGTVDGHKDSVHIWSQDKEPRDVMRGLPGLTDYFRQKAAFTA